MSVPSRGSSSALVISAQSHAAVINTGTEHHHKHDRTKKCHNCLPAATKEIDMNMNLKRERLTAAEDFTESILGIGFCLTINKAVFLT